MHVLVTCKNEDDSIKNEGARVVTTFPIISVCFFSDAQGQLTPQSIIGFWPNFEFIRTLMLFRITCKNQEDPIKNEGAVLRVLRTFSLL